MRKSESILLFLFLQCLVSSFVTTFEIAPPSQPVQMVDVGSTVTLTCEVPNEAFTTFHSLQWYKIFPNRYFRINSGGYWLNDEFKNTTRQTRYSIEQDDSLLKNVLTIQDIMKEDNGTYRCDLLERKREQPLSRVDYTVIVKESVREVIMEAEPSNEANGYTAELEDGESMSITCTSHGGNPLPTISFLLDGEDVTGEFKTTSVTKTILSGANTPFEVSDYDVVASKLNFEPPRRWTGKRLRCVAGEKDQIIEFYIKFAPDISCNDEQLAKENMTNFQLNCSIEANPLPTSTYWTFKTETGNYTNVNSSYSYKGISASEKGSYDDTITVNVALNIARVSRSDYRTYTLNTKNDVGPSSKQINLVPVARVKPGPKPIPDNPKGLSPGGHSCSLTASLLAVAFSTVTSSLMLATIRL